MLFPKKFLCETCKSYKKNKPTTPVFAFGYWVGGPDAGKCTNPKMHKDRGFEPKDAYVAGSDGCPHWKEAEA